MSILHAINVELIHKHLFDKREYVYKKIKNPKNASFKFQYAQSPAGVATVESRNRRSIKAQRGEPRDASISLLLKFDLLPANFLPATTSTGCACDRGGGAGLGVIGTHALDSTMQAFSYVCPDDFCRRVNPLRSRPLSIVRD